jgi:predicted MFS family arabinose efflux permease
MRTRPAGTPSGADRTSPGRLAGRAWPAARLDLQPVHAPTRTWQPARLALGTASALGLARFAYGLLVPAMRAELGWNLAQAGALTTANGLGYLLGAVATAPVERRLGVTATFRLGMVVTVAALAGNAATSSYPVLLLARAVAGVSGALVFIAGGVIASRIAASRGSSAPLTIFFSGAGLGIAASGAFVPPLLGHHPGRWPVAWAGLALGSALAALGSWTAARISPDSAAASAADTAADCVTGSAARSSTRSSARSSARSSTRSPARGPATPVAGLRTIVSLWRVSGAYLLFAAGYIAYITFLSAYLAAHQASVAQVAVTWAALGLTAVVAPALWSGPIHGWPGARALAASLAGISAAAVIALISAAPAVVIVSAIGYGVTFLAVPAAITRIIHTAVPRGEWTAVLAAFTVVFAVGQTAGPYLAGLLADQYGTGATLVWTAVLCAAGAGLSLTVRAAAGRAG